jgi:hypothetical protein
MATYDVTKVRKESTQNYEHIVGVTIERKHFLQQPRRRHKHQGR